MAHKTSIGGTAYEISGGRTLVNGTGYSIDKGKTLVGGTAYEVGFAPSEVTVTITGDGNYGYNAKVTIDGISYNGAKTLTVPVGTEILCEAKDDNRDRRSCIYVNGTQVVKHTNATYTYTVPENVKVVNIRLEVPDYYGMIYITEQ